MCQLTKQPDWTTYHLDYPPLTLEKARGMSLTADVFLALGNTGSAVYNKWYAKSNSIGAPPHHQTAELEEVTNMRAIAEAMQLRHPDPNLTHRIEIQDPSLQIKGSWKKLKSSEGETVRSHFAMLIWKSRVSVCGIWYMMLILIVNRPALCLRREEGPDGTILLGRLVVRFRRY